MIRILLSLSLLAAMTAFAGAGDLPSPAGSWRITEIAGRATDTSVRTTFELAANGQAAGTTGCNRYRAQGVLEGNGLSFGPGISTKMMCGPAQMAQETAFLAQLPKIRNWRLEGGKLLLLDAQNSVVLRAER